MAQNESQKMLMFDRPVRRQSLRYKLKLRTLPYQYLL